MRRVMQAARRLIWRCRMTRFANAFLLCAALAPLAAQDKPKLGPSDKASLSYVAVGGNSEGQTLGFANEYKYLWSDSSFQFNAGGVRVKSTFITRDAVGTPGAFAVTETKESKTTAENYFANVRYDHTITDRLLWFVGAGWQRNVPSGYNARYNGIGGIGYQWIKEDRTNFRTDVGLGYQKDDFIVKTPGVKESYATGTIIAHFDQKIGASSLFTSDLAWTDDLSDSKNWNGTWRNAFTTNLSEKLALKVGYDLVYNNRPAFASVDLYNLPASNPARVKVGTVPFQLKKTDTIFTTSLVITF
jgi:putative salt-induced outer membrane protein YdiY